MSGSVFLRTGVILDKIVKPRRQGADFAVPRFKFQGIPYIFILPRKNPRQREIVQRSVANPRRHASFHYPSFSKTEIGKCEVQLIVFNTGC